MNDPAAWASQWLLPLLSLLVAIVAIWFTARQVFVAQRHNKLSVRPDLFLHIEELIANNGHAQRLNLECRNYGLGPAEVLSIRFAYGDTELRVDDENAWSVALNDATGAIPGIYIDGGSDHWRYGRMAIGANERRLLAHVLFSPPELLPRVRKALLAGFTATIEYRSMYGDADTCRWPEIERDTRLDT